MIAKLRVLNITKQAEDPFAAGMALGTAMRLDNAMRKAKDAGAYTAGISVADLQLLLDYVKPYIDGVTQAIYDGQRERDEEAKAEAILQAELAKVKTFRKAYDKHIKEHKELAGPFGERVK